MGLFSCVIYRITIKVFLLGRFLCIILCALEYIVLLIIQQIAIVTGVVNVAFTILLSQYISKCLGGLTKDVYVTIMSLQKLLLYWYLFLNMERGRYFDKSYIYSPRSNFLE